jgi:hypothetical protein
MGRGGKPERKATMTSITLPIAPVYAAMYDSDGAREYCAGLIVEGLKLLEFDCAVQDQTPELDRKRRDLLMLIDAIARGRAEGAEAA